jgi:hypothetical protein
MNNQQIFQMLCDIINSYLILFCHKKSITVNGTKRQAVKSLQDYIYNELNIRTSSSNWQIEYRHPSRPENDKVDIYNLINNYHWVIEIDASRADQVAKKAFSRFALYGTGISTTPIFYVAVIYPGTKHMSSNEVIKFTKYGSEIATKMNKNNIFKTIMIDCNNCSINVLP